MVRAARTTGQANAANKRLFLVGLALANVKPRHHRLTRTKELPRKRVRRTRLNAHLAGAATVFERRTGGGDMCHIRLIQFWNSLIQQRAVCVCYYI
jgi:hypothetical protein